VVDKCRDRLLLLLLLMMRVQIWITSFTREVFSVSRRQLYRRRQEMSSFFVHKKHASKHEIVAHRRHVILVSSFGREPNMWSSRRRPDLSRWLGRLLFNRRQRTRIAIGRWQRAARAVEIQPFGQMVRHQSYWLETVIVPGNNKAAREHPRTFRPDDGRVKTHRPQTTGFSAGTDVTNSPF